MTRVGFWLADVKIEWGGTGPYTWRILENLLRRLDEASLELLVICHPENEAACKRLMQNCRGKVQIAVMPQAVHGPYRPGLLSRIRRRVGSKLFPAHFFDPTWNWLASLKLDLLHFPYQYCPPLPLPCPFICTPHDFQELHYPEFFTPQERAQRAELHWRRLEACSGAVASFPFIRQDMRQYFGLPDDKIFLCPFPYQEIELAVPTPEETNSFEKKHASRRPFLLYPAQTWQHKNHLTLIRALDHIKKSTGRQIQLICTGRKNPQFFPVIEEHLAQSSVGDQVHFLDIVPEPELYWLNKNCSLVVIPTLYEAGCFPLVEAMALEAPVICSNATHLPDTIQDRRFVFDPLQVEPLAHLILKCLDDPEFRQANLANSRKQIEHLKGIVTFPSLLQAWTAVLASQGRSNSTTVPSSS